MKLCFWVFLSLGFLTAIPAMVAQSNDSFEVGAFADYFRFADAPSPINFVGVGGRAGVTVTHNLQIEAEMAYDFKRNYTSTFSNGVTTAFATTGFRTLHGFFGPKVYANVGPLQVFVTGKVGFDNFSVTNQNAPTGFTNTVGLTNGTTAFAVYPAGGLELFAGFIGLRAEVGDDVFFLNGGAHNNLRASFGPQFRF